MGIMSLYRKHNHTVTINPGTPRLDLPEADFDAVISISQTTSVSATSLALATPSTPSPSTTP